MRVDGDAPCGASPARSTSNGGFEKTSTKNRNQPFHIRTEDEYVHWNGVNHGYKKTKINSTYGTRDRHPAKFWRMRVGWIG